MRPEQVHRHRGALDVPARPTATPRRIPRGLAGLRGLPEHEVERVTLRLVHFDPRPGPQVRETLARQQPVRLELRDGVVDVAVAADVCVALLDQARDHRDDLRQVLGGTRLVVGPLDAERRAVLVVRADEPLGERTHRLAVLGGALDDLVVDVRDVADERDAVARRLQVTAHDVERDQHAGVTEVAEVVDGHAADVHAHFARHDRAERFLAAGQRIVDLQHRRFSLDSVVNAPRHGLRLRPVAQRLSPGPSVPRVARVPARGCCRSGPHAAACKARRPSVPSPRRPHGSTP